MEKTFIVDGMKCPHCKANVENALKSLNGVSKAEANIENKNVTVGYDEAVVSIDDMRKAVAAAGHYSLEA